MAFEKVELAVVFQESMYLIDHRPELSMLSEKSVRDTIVFNDCAKAITDKYSKKSDEPCVSVMAGTTFDTARALYEKYNGTKKIAVLNFANAYRPGGGVVGGARAQEECLCRCSTLYRSLKKVAESPDFYERHKLQKIKNKYAMNQKGMIYTPDVAIFRTDDYEILEQPVLVDVITNAAPEMFQYDCMEDELRDIHIEKAKAIMNIAIENEVDVIVLGAFGCGAFRNPPEVVADVYKQTLNMSVSPELKYKNCFQEVVFAIRSSNELENENFATFDRILTNA